MSRRVNQPSPEAKETLRALRRAAKNALELGLKTGTPVWVVKDNKLVDLTKEHRTSKESPSKRSSRKSDSRKTVASRRRSKYSTQRSWIDVSAGDDTDDFTVTCMTR